MIGFCLFLSCVVGFAGGFILCDVTAGNSPKTKKAKKAKNLEELTDRELFSAHVAIFNEISRRGAELMEPFEEFKKK